MGCFDFIKCRYKRETVEIRNPTLTEPLIEPTRDYSTRKTSVNISDYSPPPPPPMKNEANPFNCYSSKWVFE